MGLEGPHEKKGWTRRQVMGGIAAAAAAASGVGVLEHLRTSSKQEKAKEEQKKEPEAIPEFDFMNDYSQPEHFPAGALAGAKVAHLYAMYLGLPEAGARVENEIAFNPKRQIAYLWQRKLGIEKFRGDSRDEHILKHAYSTHPDLFALAERLYASYDLRAPKSDIHTYEAHVNDAIAPVRQSLERAIPVVEKHFRLSHEQSALVREAQRHLTGKTLIAYSLTELMPSYDGALNKTMLDFLLRTAGEGFIERVPAIHDQLVSYGPYQLTGYALNGENSASAVDNLLHQRFLPPDVSSLKGLQHHQAAYLFAVYNLVRLAQSLKSGELVRQVRRIIATEPHVVVLFAAVAHNKPSEAIDAMYSCAEARIAYEKHLHQLHVQNKATHNGLRHGTAQEIAAEHSSTKVVKSPPPFSGFIVNTASQQYAQKTEANVLVL